MYETDLGKGPANSRPLTPLDFLSWAAHVYPDKTAIIFDASRYTYRQFEQRCRRLAGALARRGVGLGDTVAVIAPNVPALLEAHYGVPMVGAVLNAINIRLDAASVAFILAHGDAKILIVDGEFVNLAENALAILKGRRPPMVVAAAAEGPGREAIDYEDFLATGDPAFAWRVPADEWQAIALNYTSGTTGNPKGVVYHHRGAFLNAMANAMTFRLSPDSVYLWTLPMFHCSGWSYTWAVTAVAGTHVCLRRLDPATVFSQIESHGVTHLCGAPTVLSMLIHADRPAGFRLGHVVQVATGGASPPSTVIAAMEDLGFRITHLYGLTESYGPATVCMWQDSWNLLPLAERARKMARQGVRHVALGELIVADGESGRPVPADGQTLGEILLRGHTLMKGYLKNPAATAEAFRDGWFHTGDLAVMHDDGYIEIKDRSKDIFISGGENISSLEVEEVLYQHPDVMEAAVSQAR